jgi:NADH dehydrogenase [ubiquinone] 1 alpha subcomplex assembly factor 7
MTAPAARPETTPLEQRLVELIRTNGPISVADYMTDALGHPHDGYYMTQEAIGAAGDFTTAPEISQIFGELIGLWLVEAWFDMGSPGRFNLVELGPGRGTLMADILRAAELRPEFLKAATLFLVETSGRLRLEQQRALRGRKLKPLWADEFSEIPAAPLLLVANEFFDCLPIRQFERTAAGWRERLVGLEDDRLAFVLASAPPLPDTKLPPAEECAEGTVAEIGPTGEALAREIAKTLVAEGGRALVIDYGHFGAGLGDTLQAVRGHAFCPPLSAPGKADLTAHVDFEALARAALAEGATVWGPVSQGAFLARLGLEARAERLAAGKPEAERETILAGVRRLSAPEEMGEIFKALCVSASHLPPPAGFAEP